MEQVVHNTVIEFSREICKLEARKPGADASISLEMKYKGYGEGRKIAVSLSCHFYDGENFSTVRANSLGALMDEVYRRLGFADREALKIDTLEASLHALPAPDDE